MNEVRLAIKCNEKGSDYTFSGNMTSGLVKLLVGQLELIKQNLLLDLQASLDKYDEEANK